jgi:hypothetical protein
MGRDPDRLEPAAWAEARVLPPKNLTTVMAHRPVAHRSGNSVGGQFRAFTPTAVALS